MNIEEVNKGCRPAPQETIKSIASDICKAACEIDYVLRAMEAQTFDVRVDEPKTEGADTLEASLIFTKVLMSNIMARLHDFSDRMGVGT